MAECIELALVCVCVCVCSNGKGDVHCQLEKKSGNLPEFWGWLANAQYTGNVTYHEVVYNEWSFHVSSTVVYLLPGSSLSCVNYINCRLVVWTLEC